MKIISLVCQYRITRSYLSDRGTKYTVRNRVGLSGSLKTLRAFFIEDQWNGSEFKKEKTHKNLVPYKLGIPVVGAAWSRVRGIGGARVCGGAGVPEGPLVTVHMASFIFLLPRENLSTDDKRMFVPYPHFVPNHQFNKKQHPKISLYTEDA